MHDAYVDRWFELELQDTYSAPGPSWARFFRNQSHLEDTKAEKDLAATLKTVEAVLFVVPHTAYRNLDLDWVVNAVGGRIAAIDSFGILSDARIRRYFELVCEVKALGRGHIQRIKEEVRSPAAG